MQNAPGKTALGLDINVGSMLCYLPICLIGLIYSIIVIVSDKDNKNVRFHAFQSLLVSAAYIVVVIALQIFGAVVAGVTGSSALGGIFFLLVMLVLVAFLGIMIMGCIKGYQGGSFKLPIVGDMAEKWS